MAEEKKPLVVFVTGDHEYSREETLPVLFEIRVPYRGIRKSTGG